MLADEEQRIERRKAGYIDEFDETRNSVVSCRS
jgi:hypothetical protein